MSTSIAARAVSKALVIALALLAACGDSNPIVEPPPPVAVASVAVSPPNQSLIVGSQLTLEATPKSANGQELARAVTWTSANEQFATVSATGVVTALAVGEVSIRATSEGKFGLSLITILPVPQVPVADVRLSVDEEIVLEWDGVASITARAYDAQGNELIDRHVQWSSNRPSIAAVVNGTIEAQNPGTATITATVEGIVASVGVRVNQAPIVSVRIEAVTTGLEVGESFIFAAPVERANGETTYGPANWTSSMPGVARVEPDVMYAVVEAVSEGTFTLSASVEGKTASLMLTVTAKPTHDLIYNRWKDGGSEIFTLSTLNPSEVPVKINAGNVSREASPSPDGTQIVFAVSQTNPTTGEMQNDLYIVNRNGMNMRWLTRTAGMESEPKWSPDGTRILFRADGGGKIDLYTVNALDGSGLTNLTSFIGAEMMDKNFPAWSPNGDRIVFTGAVGGKYKIYTMAANGSDLKQITTDDGFDGFPSFSNDGEKIAFTRYNATGVGFGYDVMVVSSAGGTPIRFALPGDQLTPAWSPDGKFIAVSGTATAGTGIQQIYTMRSDGTGLRLRTINPADGGGVWPAWIAR